MVVHISKAILCVRNVDVGHMNLKFVITLAKSCIIRYKSFGGAYCLHP